MQQNSTNKNYLKKKQFNKKTLNLKEIVPLQMKYEIFLVKTKKAKKKEIKYKMQKTQKQRNKTGLGIETIKMGKK